MMMQRLQELGLKSSASQAVIDRLNEIRASGRLQAASVPSSASAGKASSRPRKGATASAGPGPGAAADLSLEDCLRLDPYLALTGVRGVTFR